jgi:hypothetical protein
MLYFPTLNTLTLFYPTADPTTLDLSELKLLLLALLTLGVLFLLTLWVDYLLNLYFISYILETRP